MAIEDSHRKCGAPYPIFKPTRNRTSTNSTEFYELYVVNCDLFHVGLPDTIARFEYIGCIFQDHLFSWILVCRIRLPEAPKLTQRPWYFLLKTMVLCKRQQKRCVSKMETACHVFRTSWFWKYQHNQLRSQLSMSMFIWGGLQQRWKRHLWRPKIPPSWRGWKRHLRRWLRYHGWWFKVWMVLEGFCCFPSELILDRVLEVDKRSRDLFVYCFSGSGGFAGGGSAN